MTRSDTFGLVTGSTWIFSSEPPVLLITKNNRLSCITRLKIHHQLENHRKELFSTELHWEIFCGITSYDYNSRRLGHVTSPELKMAERDVSISLRRRLRNPRERVRLLGRKNASRTGYYSPNESGLVVG